MRGRSKYGNVRTNGYDSKREANVGASLQALARAGKIQNLREQVPFELIPKQPGESPCKYVADFVFEEDGKQVVMDAKGKRTEVYRIKRKLMSWVHGIKIEEV